MNSIKNLLYWDLGIDTIGMEINSSVHFIDEILLDAKKWFFTETCVWI
jgi:hypothetical protein